MADYGHSYSEQRYSTLKQIDTTNVAAWVLGGRSRSGRRWTARSNAPVRKRCSLWDHELEHHVCCRRQTGKEIWRYDPQVVRGSVRLCCGVMSRGIALYEGRVIVPVVDGRLVALDAATGKFFGLL